MSNVVSDFLKYYRAENPEEFSPAKKFGELMAQEFQNNPHFYFFSPDETTSNKFDAIFDVEKRAWNLPKEPWDLPNGKNGRIIEMLSENVLFSVMTGHLMNGETAMMGSYEAFYPIITSQILQQIKFFNQADRASWRNKIPAVNLLSTSTCWRQDHNGYTHQSPALISTLLTVPSDRVNCIFPLDDTTVTPWFKFMLESKNIVNLATFNKIDEPRFLDPERAETQFKNSGAIVLEEYSDDDPDFVFVGVGDLVMNEVVEAVKMLKEDLPSLRLRCINLAALSYRAIGPIHDKLSREAFVQLFTPDKPIIANFHGYPETLETIFENYTYRGRIRVHGYIEEGSTTTPHEMLRLNGASRYDLAIDVVKALNKPALIDKYRQLLAENHNYAIKYGVDKFWQLAI